jgi:hypothetical protein
MMPAAVVYAGSSGDLTKAYYAQLAERGAIGFVAMNLFRAQKCSARAKLYRGGGFKDAAYERKNWSMGLLAHALAENGASLGITFGWKQDPAQAYHNWVMYIDLPPGQCSFHAATRGEGPDYAGEWDGQHLSAERILEFCDLVMGLEPGATGVVVCAEAPAASVALAPSRLKFGDPDAIARKRRRA